MDRPNFRPRNDSDFRRSSEFSKAPRRRSRSPMRRRDDVIPYQDGRRPPFAGPRDAVRRNPEFRPRDEPRNSFGGRPDYREPNVNRTNGQRSFNSEDSPGYDVGSKWTRRDDAYRRPPVTNRVEPPFRTPNPVAGSYRSSQMNHRYEKPAFERGGEPRSRGMQMMSKPERIANDRYPQLNRGFPPERPRSTMYRDSNRPRWK